MCYLLRGFVVLLSVLAASAGALTFESATDRPTVIELYTSEGCSSCPPAERWLSLYAKNDDLWTKYFPIAWHVDYWDAVGWPDRYASPRYSQRQWLYLKQTSLTSVYTPGVLVNGRAWRGWISGRHTPENHNPAIGKLSVELDGRHFRAQLEPTEAEPSKIYILHSALLGFGLTTEVKRGENVGKTLQHQFVVLADKQYGRGETEWQGKLPVIPKTAGDAVRLALIFWLQQPNSPVPLQMAGGWYVLPEKQQEEGQTQEQVSQQPEAVGLAEPQQQ